MLKAIKRLLEKIRIQIAILQKKVRIEINNYKRTLPVLDPPRFIIVHHGGGDWHFNQVNEHHANLWQFCSSLGFYLGYQYWIGYKHEDGMIQARADNEEGAHTVGNTPKYYNRCSIGICLRGDMNIRKPTEWQLKELKKLIDQKKAEYNIPNNRVKGHRELSQTSCPGEHLWKWLIVNYPD